MTATGQTVYFPRCLPAPFGSSLLKEWAASAGLAYDYRSRKFIDAKEVERRQEARSAYWREFYVRRSKVPRVGLEEWIRNWKKE